MNGSLFIAEVSSIEEVKSIVESDIYYKTGVVSLAAQRLVRVSH